jgi:hypothetical protein
MIEFLAKAIDVFKWIKNMISPIIIALVIDVFIYFNFQNIYGISICILILIIGIISGIKLANYLQKI